MTFQKQLGMELIIPTDSYFLRGVGIPPTGYEYWYVTESGFNVSDLCNLSFRSVPSLEFKLLNSAELAGNSGVIDQFLWVATADSDSFGGYI